MTEYRHGQADRIDDEANWNPGRAPRAMWSGWVWFAGVVLIITGMIGAFEGMVALFNRNYYVAGPNNVLVFDVTGWGWVHLIIGALLLLTGVALLFDAAWARVATVILAGLDVIAQLASIGVYPLWSVISITLCVLVIWAIVVHGDDSRISL